MGGKYFSKDEMRAIHDILIEEIDVPEWGDGKVIVCGLSARSKDLYQSSLVDIKGSTRRVKLEDAAAKLVIRCVLDPEAYAKGARKLYFSEADIEWLGTKSAAALERINKVAQRLSAMNQEEVEALVKNSDAAQSDDSPTVSL